MARKRRGYVTRRARKGFRGYPIATVAFYGPNNRVVTKVAVSIVSSEAENEPSNLERWYSEDGSDLRKNAVASEEMSEFIQAHTVKSVVMTDGIIGCPHEEGKDYPDGEVCPQCPFWANRDRWTGELLKEN